MTLQFQRKIIDNMQLPDRDQSVDYFLPKPKGRTRSVIQNPREPHFQVSSASRTIQDNIKETQRYFQKNIKRYESWLAKIQNQFDNIGKSIDNVDKHTQKLTALLNKEIQTIQNKKNQQADLEAKIAVLQQGPKTTESQLNIEFLEFCLEGVREQLEGYIASKNDLNMSRDENIKQSESYTRQQANIREEKQACLKRLENLQKYLQFR